MTNRKLVDQSYITVYPKYSKFSIDICIHTSFALRIRLPIGQVIVNGAYDKFQICRSI